MIEIKKAPTFTVNANFILNGAQDETRTHTPFPALPPQGSVYTNFTTCALYVYVFLV